LIESIGKGAWEVDSGKPGPSVCLSFGTHGNERAPIDAGQRLVADFQRGEVTLARGRLFLLCSNPRASREDERWSKGGVDLNRCFHADVLAREPSLYEERRAREIVAWLEDDGVEVLVDFHCTVEPGSRFLMHHPPARDPAYREVASLLEAEVELADPDLFFGAVSLDEWMSTRGRVGICYETGWLGDPANTPEGVRGEMLNVLAGHEMIDREPRRYEPKRLIQLRGTAPCESEGFRWSDGVGENLQEVAAGTVLGRYGDGREVVLEEDATLVFPKKKPELVQLGKPLVLLARRIDG
jgi:succinylglutamate desuccinylase